MRFTGRMTGTPLAVGAGAALLLAGCAQDVREQAAEEVPEAAVSPTLAPEPEEEGPEEYEEFPAGADLAWRIPLDVDGWEKDEDGSQSDRFVLRKTSGYCSIRFVHFPGNAAKWAAQGYDGPAESLGEFLDNLEAGEGVEEMTRTAIDPLQFDSAAEEPFLLDAVRADTTSPNGLGITYVVGTHWGEEDEVMLSVLCPTDQWEDDEARMRELLGWAGVVES